MIQTEENTEQARQYLFGELNETERDALEERLFADEEFALYLDAVEDDLVDEYARGEMNAAQKQKFENKYLISEARRSKVRAAGILQKELFAEKPAVTVAERPGLWQTLAGYLRPPQLAFAGGFAMILLLLGVGGWLLLRGDRPIEVAQHNSNQATPTPQPTAPPETPRETPANENTAPPANNNTAAPANTNRAPQTAPSPTRPAPHPPESAPPPARVFVATLLPPLRSGERPELALPAATETVRLRVVHDNEQLFTKYRAEIRDQNGDLVWSREIPVSEKTLARPLTLNVRRAALADGAYELTLSGMTADRRLEEIKFYNFTVKKR